RLVEASRLRRRLTPVDGTARLKRRKPAPDPVAAVRGADEWIVSTAALLPGAKRLAAHRAATGVRAVVLPWADLVEDAGGNAEVPVLAGLLRLSARAVGAKPRFVLLCGDATFDRDDLVKEETIPTRYVP